MGRKAAPDKEKGARVSCAFCDPSKRQQPLPLLPFGSGGVGGAAAARFPENGPEDGEAGTAPAGQSFYPSGAGPVNSADTNSRSARMKFSGGPDDSSRKGQYFSSAVLPRFNREFMPPIQSARTFHAGKQGT